MILFGLLAALLIALALAALIVPLKRGHAGAAEATDSNLSEYRARLAELDAERAAQTLSETDYQRARADLERGIVAGLVPEPGNATTPRSGGAWLAPLIGVLVPALALGVYLRLGTPAAIDFAPPSADPEEMRAQIAGMVDGLAARLERNPDDVTGWRMLARSFLVLDRPDDARRAYQRGLERFPDDAGLIADYVEVLARLADGDLRGEPTALIERAYARAPDDAKVLWLAGAAAFQKGDYPGAIDRLERLQRTAELGAEEAQFVTDILTRARSSLDRAPAPGPESSTAAVVVHVALAPALQSLAKPDDRLFVFARPAGGGPPLAAVSKRVSDLPITVRLDDTLAMNPAHRLSQADAVVVGARVARAGTATRAAGDLEALSSTLRLGTETEVGLVIDTVVP